MGTWAPKLLALLLVLATTSLHLSPRKQPAEPHLHQVIDLFEEGAFEWIGRGEELTEEVLRRFIADDLVLETESSGEGR